MFGKPNIIINPHQISNGSYVYKGLEQLKPEEIINIAENNMKETGVDPTLQKVIFNIEKNKEDNEYNRTTV